MSGKSLSTLLGQLQDDGSSDVTICSNWFNGRAAYGGLVGAIAATAMEKALDEQQPLRSLMVNFAGPVPADTVVVEPKILRSGKSVTQVAAEIKHGEQVLTHASAAFGKARAGATAPSEYPFEPAPRDSVPPLSDAAGMLPGFLSNFIIHWTGGAIPMSGSNDRRTGIWLKHKDDVGAYPAAKLIAIADMPPPIILSHYSHMIKASSLSWALEFVRPAEEVEGDWFYLDFELEAAADGYSQQTGRIFDEKGNLCAVSRQCMVYFE